MRLYPGGKGVGQSTITMPSLRRQRPARIGQALPQEGTVLTGKSLSFTLAETTQPLAPMTRELSW